MHQANNNKTAGINFREWWQLHSENGRQVWKFLPPEAFAHVDFNSPEGRAMLDEMSRQFVFDKTQNPNSGDAVFRSSKTQTFSNAKAQTAAQALQNGWDYFTALQSDEGHWAGDYGGPMFLLPGYVIVCHITGVQIAVAQSVLMIRYMLNHQNNDGGWGLHLEGGSTMFGTCLQYVSLRILGLPANHEAIAKARAWIHKNGGAKGIPPWGKFYLSCLNVYEWEGCHSLLPELWLLPELLPIHPSRYWCHARMVYLPMAYCFGVKLKAAQSELTSQLRNELYIEPYEKINWREARSKCATADVYHPAHAMLGVLNFCSNTYEAVYSKKLRKKATDFCYNYIQAEDKQTNYIDIGPVNKMMNMLCVWHKEGAESVAFKAHEERLQDYLWLSEDGMKMQGYNGSQFWDTAFATLAMKESGADTTDSDNYKTAVEFIVSQQVTEEPFQWKQFFRHSSKGGFPFSTKAHGWPITDCTAEGVKVLLNENIETALLHDAVELILSFQNADGGWASYENSRAPRWIEALNPSLIFGNIMIDYSYTECSSASIQALIKYHKKYPERNAHKMLSAIKKGIGFILAEQHEDGSWYGSWAVCFTYGTWFAAEALAAVKSLNLFDERIIENALSKTKHFLLSKQMNDGGWGEDFESCVQKKYIHSKTSQNVNTAWALMALMCCNAENEVIEKSIQLLVEKQLPNGDWQQEQICGVFNHNCMISYTNYRNIFPLWALGRFVRLRNATANH